MDRQNDCEESIENDDLDDDRSNDDFDCDEPEARLVFPKVSTGNGPTINIVPGDAEQSVQTAERTTAPDFVVAELGEIIAENERNKSQSEDLAMEVLGVNNESNDKVDRFVETELGAAKEAKSGAEEAKTLESYERLRHKAKMNSLEHDRLDSEEHDHQEAKRLNNQIHWDEAEVVQDQVNLKEAERELEAQGLKNSEELDDIKVNNEAVLEKIASTEESRLAQLKVGEQNADAVDEINRETHRHHQKLAKDIEKDCDHFQQKKIPAPLIETECNDEKDFSSIITKH